MSRRIPIIAGLVLAACGSDRVVPAGGGGNNARADAAIAPTEDAAAPAAPDAGTAAAEDAAIPDSGTEPPRGDVAELSLGDIHVENGKSEPVAFDLPDGVTSFMLVIDGPEVAWFVPERLDGPTGNLVSDDGSMVTQLERFLLGPFAAQFKSPNRVIHDLGLDASLYPNNPGVTVSGGSYTLVVAGLVPAGNGMPFTGDVKATVYYRSAVPTAGRIDLHLYFTGAGGIDAQSAPNDPLIQGAIAKLGEIYAQAAIEIGAIAYHDADPGFRTIRNLDGSAVGDLERLQKTSGTNGGGLHFFFVDRFESAFPGATVAGVSGGLPGAPRHVGSIGSGVAVALAPANGNPDILAHVMAHEGGHWLGLFHTSEITGTVDQHPETPPGMAGQTHLMYPAVGGGTMISPSQGAVMRAHVEVESR